MRGRVGILSAAAVARDCADVYCPTDAERYDGYTSHVCCSIQFPNAHYLAKVRERDPLFKDWVVIALDPKYLWAPKTLFCPVNAARDRGAHVAEGVDSFENQFAPRPRGSNFSRSYSHRLDCPTDMQAEVLIPDQIARSDILGIYFPSAQAGKTERARWELGNIPGTPPPFRVSAQFFDANELRKVVRDGLASVESDSP